MFIKFDETELFDFFEGQPILVGDEDAGDFIYTFRDNGFKLILFLSTYEMYVNVSITYNENIVFSQKYVNVSEIEQIDNQNIKIVLNDKDTVLLKKKPQIGVITE